MKLVAVFLAWSIAPLIYLLWRAASAHTSLTGVDSVLAPGDKLRHLAWIRDAGEHAVIANPFRCQARRSPLPAADVPALGHRVAVS